MEDRLSVIRKNDKYWAIERYYSTPSVWGIIGCDRKEGYHTRFISWVLTGGAGVIKDPKEPIRLFLKSLNVTEAYRYPINEHESLAKTYDDLNEVLAEDSQIIRVEASAQVSEKCDDEVLERCAASIPNNRVIETGSSLEDANRYVRPDLILYVEYSKGEEEYLLPIVIENKINALETTKLYKGKRIGQSVYYREVFNRDYFVSHYPRKEWEITVKDPVYVYWTAKTDAELYDLEDSKYNYNKGYCQSPNYIYYNYQAFIYQVLEETLITDRAEKRIIEDYIRACAWSEVPESAPLAYPREVCQKCRELCDDKTFREAMLEYSKTSDKEIDETVYKILRCWVDEVIIHEHKESEVQRIKALLSNKGKKNKKYSVEIFDGPEGSNASVLRYIGSKLLRPDAGHERHVDNLIQYKGFKELYGRSKTFGEWAEKYRKDRPNKLLGFKINDDEICPFDDAFGTYEEEIIDTVGFLETEYADEDIVFYLAPGAYEKDKTDAMLMDYCREYDEIIRIGDYTTDKPFYTILKKE